MWLKLKNCKKCLREPKSYLDFQNGRLHGLNPPKVNVLIGGTKRLANKTEQHLLAFHRKAKNDLVKHKWTVKKSVRKKHCKKLFSKAKKHCKH